MAEYLSPGVYVEEYDSSPQAIEGVGTSTAGFVGLAEKGPTIGQPVLVTNLGSFQKQFGGHLSEFSYEKYRFLAHSVEQFFANGGTRCYVARVIPVDAAAAKKEAGLLSFQAANEGKWGNRIQVALSTVLKKKMQLLEKAEESGTSYRAKTVEGFREGDLVVCKGQYNRIVTILDEIVTFEKAFTEEVIDTALVPKTVVFLAELDMTIRYNETSEVYAGLSYNINSPMFIGTKIASSELVKVTVRQMMEPVDPVEAVFGEGITQGSLLLEGGSDGNVAKVNAETFIGKDGGPGRRTGIASFLENSVISMLAVPGVTIPEVMASVVAHCENLGNRFAVLDMPEDLYKTQDLIDYRSMIDSTYAAMYHPWIQVFDRAAGRPAFIPPSGAVMGVYSRTDITRGVHKAPANETISCTGLKTGYTRGEQDILNPEGINLIRSIPGMGIRIWGARTASSNASFKYVNVRRLFIYIEESIKANTNWVVFEPNDATLWNRVALTVSAFLNTLWRSGMLAGETPEQAYFVEIGNTTMTRDDIMNGRLICNIGIAPTRPAEFVIFRVTQFTAESGGES